MVLLHLLKGAEGLSGHGKSPCKFSFLNSLKQQGFISSSPWLVLTAGLLSTMAHSLTGLGMGPTSHTTSLVEMLETGSLAHRGLQ